MFSPVCLPFASVLRVWGQFSLPVYMFVHMCVSTHIVLLLLPMGAHVEARGQCQVSSFISLHLVYWGQICYLNWWLTQLDNSQLARLLWGYSLSGIIDIYYAQQLLCVRGFQTSPHTFLASAFPLSHLSSLCLFIFIWIFGEILVFVVFLIY